MKTFLLALFGFLLSFLICNIVWPNSIEEQIQRDMPRFIQMGMVDKCNQQRCDKDEVLKSAIRFAKSYYSSRPITANVNGPGTAIMIGVSAHVLMRIMDGPVTDRVNATIDSWKRDRENERHRARYRERREDRERRERRERERARNELIRRDRY